MSVSFPRELKRDGGTERGKKKRVSRKLEDRAEMKEDRTGGSYCGFISVWLLAGDRSSLAPDLLLITELCDQDIHPPVRTAGSPRVRENWPCRDWSGTSV